MLRDGSIIAKSRRGFEVRLDRSGLRAEAAASADARLTLSLAALRRGLAPQP